MPGIIDTNLVPPSRRIAYLNEAMEKSPLPHVDLSDSLFDSNDFRFRFECHMMADAFFTSLRMQDVLLKRLDRHIAYRPCNLLLIAVLRSGNYDQQFEYHAPFPQVGPGDILIIDLDAPQSVTFANNSAVTCAYVPRRHFEPFIGTAPLLRPVMIRPDNELHGLLCASLRSCASMRNPSAVASHAALQTITRLAMVAHGMDPRLCEDLKSSVLEARRARAQMFIATHCANPRLDAQRVAVHLGISLRSLHLAFEPTGTGVSTTIMKTRLAYADQLLRSFPTRSVLDIALEVGFNNLATFYRGFTRQYGAPPGEYRSLFADRLHY